MPTEMFDGTIRLQQVRLLRSGDFYVKSGWKYGPTSNAFHQIVFFPAGSDTKYGWSSKAATLNKPCVIITPPGEKHSYEFDPSHPVRHLFVNFEWKTATAPSGMLQLKESLCLHTVEETFVPHLLKQILYLSSKKVYLWEDRCKLLLVSALAELEGLRGIPSSKSAGIADTKHSLPVLKALDYIDKHLKDDISIAALAEEVGWTHEHFTRRFVQYTGMTPQKSILVRRIERACQLLIQEKWNISQIAYAVGFHNVHYFYRAFMSMKGMTASTYRQKFSAPDLKHLSVVDEYQESYPLNHYFYYSN